MTASKTSTDTAQPLPELCGGGVGGLAPCAAHCGLTSQVSGRTPSPGHTLHPQGAIYGPRFSGAVMSNIPPTWSIRQQTVRPARSVHPFARKTRQHEGTQEREKRESEALASRLVDTSSRMQLALS